MAVELISLIGKSAADPEMMRAVAEYSLSDIYDTHPGRRYVASHMKGVALVFENDCMTAVQIFVAPTDPFSAYSEMLPFMLRRGMSEAQVHELLGSPEKSNIVQSHFLLCQGELFATVEYDQAGVMKYLSVTTPTFRPSKA
jgi:hypothetical protein